MKIKLSKKTLWQSLLSVIVLGIFILMAVGSGIFWALKIPEPKMIKLADGTYQETSFTVSQKKTTTGHRDQYNNWTGPVKIVWSGGRYGYTEECTMLGGKRMGLSTRTYNYSTADGPVKEENWYVNDVCMPKAKSAHIRSENISAFQVLGNKYPWFLFSLNAYGFDSTYIEAYMDTVETLLNNPGFNASEFDTYYGDVVDSLSKTPYDTLITFNSNLSLYKGLEEMKNSEFRMAVIDRYRSDGKTTYSIVGTTYPGYLKAMNDSGVVNQDFEIFCQNMDSCMTSYGPLDLKDTFFVDSIDAHIYRALNFVLNTEKSSSFPTKLALKRAILTHNKDDLRGLLSEFKSILNPMSLTSSPSEVAQVVLTFMLTQYINADMLRQVFMEAFNSNKGVIKPPKLGTIFEGNNSATSVTLQGFLVEDGGASVSSVGIAWATFYNPTILDNPVTSGTATGSFRVTLTGLTKGTTYYARTFATNTVGTAYGNCIKFIAGDISGIDNTKIDAPDFTIYPNPASALTTFCFKLESSENIVLSMTDMNGKIVFQKNLGSLPQGETRINLDLSNLQNGMYTCQLTNGIKRQIRKFEITH